MATTGTRSARRAPASPTDPPSPRVTSSAAVSTSSTTPASTPRTDIISVSRSEDCRPISTRQWACRLPARLSTRTSAISPSYSTLRICCESCAPGPGSPSTSSRCRRDRGNGSRCYTGWYRRTWCTTATAALRRRISSLVMCGRIGEAIESTRRAWPALLERDPELLFLLKCRQFVEMVNGADSEVTQACSNGVATSVISHTSQPAA
ncbi:unnamed protein product, partial [Leptidea sinapis]